MCDWADRKQNVWEHRPHSHAYVQVRSVWLNKVSTIVTETDNSNLIQLMDIVRRLALQNFSSVYRQKSLLGTYYLHSWWDLACEIPALVSQGHCQRSPCVCAIQQPLASKDTEQPRCKAGPFVSLLLLMATL